MPASAATRSAVATIASPPQGSRRKLSSTQCSRRGLPPGAEGAGQLSSGPLEVRSVVMTRHNSSSPASTRSAAACTHAAEVAHACDSIAPLVCCAPMRAATVETP